MTRDSQEMPLFWFWQSYWFACFHNSMIHRFLFWAQFILCHSSVCHMILLLQTTHSSFVANRPGRQRPGLLCCWAHEEDVAWHSGDECHGLWNGSCCSAMGSVELCSVLFCCLKGLYDIIYSFAKGWLRSLFLFVVWLLWIGREVIDVPF